MIRSYIRPKDKFASASLAFENFLLRVLEVADFSIWLLEGSVLDEIGEEDFKFEFKFVNLQLLWLNNLVEERYYYASKADELK